MLPNIQIVERLVLSVIGCSDCVTIDFSVKFNVGFPRQVMNFQVMNFPKEH